MPFYSFPNVRPTLSSRPGTLYTQIHTRNKVSCHVLSFTGCDTLLFPLLFYLLKLLVTAPQIEFVILGMVHRGQFEKSGSRSYKQRRENVGRGDLLVVRARIQRGGRLPRGEASHLLFW